MAFTYTVGTTLGRVRALIKDTVRDGHIWEDGELEDFLDLASSNHRLAAAYALEAEAGDAARLASVIRLGTFGDNEKTVFDALLAMAKHLIDTAGMGAGAGSRVSKPTVAPIFEAETEDDVGTMDVW